MIRGVENSSQSPTSAGAVKPGGLRDSPMHKQKEEQRQKMSSAFGKIFRERCLRVRGAPQN